MWQEFFEKNRSKRFTILSVAVDLQGPEVVRTFVDRARATFPVAVDAEDAWGRTFGSTVIPVSILVDETGLVRLRGAGPSPEFLKKIEAILAEEPAAVAPPGEDSRGPEAPATPWVEKVRRARQLLAASRRAEAAAALKEALALEPQNWLLRKQVWALEHPEKFYGGPIDTAWQKEQVEKERPPR